MPTPTVTAYAVRLEDGTAHPPIELWYATEVRPLTVLDIQTGQVGTVFARFYLDDKGLLQIVQEA